MTACDPCRGFGLNQHTPGRFTVCRACHGSGVEGVLGDREPGLCVRDSTEGSSSDTPYGKNSAAARDGSGGKWKRGVNRQKAAYKLGKAGKKWTDVAAACGYHDASKARMAAKAYAIRCGLPPIVRNPRSASTPIPPRVTMAEAPRAAPTTQRGGALVGARGASL